MKFERLLKFQKEQPVLAACLAGVFFSVFLLFGVTFLTGDTFGLWARIGISTPRWAPEAGYADCKKAWNRSSPYCRGEMKHLPAARPLPDNDFDRMKKGGKKMVPFNLH
jgi:hypothetical protein